MISNNWIETNVLEDENKLNKDILQVKIDISKDVLLDKSGMDEISNRLKTVRINIFYRMRVGYIKYPTVAEDVLQVDSGVDKDILQFYIWVTEKRILKESLHNQGQCKPVAKNIHLWFWIFYEKVYLWNIRCDDNKSVDICDIKNWSFLGVS